MAARNCRPVHVGDEQRGIQSKLRYGFDILHVYSNPLHSLPNMPAAKRKTEKEEGSSDGASTEKRARKNTKPQKFTRGEL